MAEKVASFRFDSLNTDLPAVVAPENAWTSLSNFIPRNGLYERVTGDAAISASSDTSSGTHLGPIAGMQIRYYSSPGVLAAGPLVYGLLDGTTPEVWAWSGSAHTNVTDGKWSATTNGTWTTTQLSDYVYCINVSTNPPLFYDTLTALCDTLDGWLDTGNARCLALRAFNDHLFALNVDNEPDAVYWSDAASINLPPSTWTPSATNQAGSAFLGTGGGAIVDGLPLRDKLLIYKKQAIWIAERIAGNDVYGFRRLFGNVGALATNCIASDGLQHYFFTGKDLLVTDGSRWQSMLSAKARSLINVDTTNWARSFVYYDPVGRQVHCCWPASGASRATKDLVVDVTTGQWGLRDLDSAQGMLYVQDGISGSSEFGETWMADPLNDRWLRMDSGSTFAGTSISANVVRAGLTFGDPGRQKVITWVRPIIEAPDGAVTVTVEVSATQNPDDALSYGSAVNFATASADKANMNSAAGRYIAIRLASSGGLRWRCAGFDVGYELTGGY